MIDHAKPKDEIPVTEAIRIAKQYVGELYADSSIHDLMLEEIKRSEDGARWLITVGFSRREHKKKTQSSFASLSEQLSLTAAVLRREQLLERDYKLLEIDAVTGEVKSMRIRDISQAL
ncbi:MAG: hypothetical protein ACE37H_09530 [Phycisphaeraceae bacterium]